MAIIKDVMSKLYAAFVENLAGASIILVSAMSNISRLARVNC